MAEVSIKKHPKNLDLTTINLPLPGKVSILHRVSGAGLFLFLPVLLWLFGVSLSSAEGYAALKSMLHSLPVKLILAGLLWAFVYHFCAGIRFLLLDLHVGVEKGCARKSAGVVLAVSILLTLILWRVVL